MARHIDCSRGVKNIRVPKPAEGGPQPAALASRLAVGVVVALSDAGLVTHRRAAGHDGTRRA